MNKIHKIVIPIIIFLFCKTDCYIKYSIEIKKNIKVEGYKPFSLAVWKHPSLINDQLKGILSKPILDNMKKIIPYGSIVIDIGGHTGDYAVAYSLIVGNKGRVVSFEPNPACFKVLKKNAKLNNNIIAFNLAITQTDGLYTFHYSDKGLAMGGFATAIENGLKNAGENIPVKVKGINLENWLNKHFKNQLNKIKFIKIDTEGYDKNILQSIKNLVLKYKPVIQCEIYPLLTIQEKTEFYNLIESIKYKTFLHGQPLNKANFINTKFADIFCLPIEANEKDYFNL